jgi:hypothetical protein
MMEHFASESQPGWRFLLTVDSASAYSDWAGLLFDPSPSKAVQWGSAPSRLNEDRITAVP